MYPRSGRKFWIKLTCQTGSDCLACHLSKPFFHLPSFLSSFLCPRPTGAGSREHTRQLLARAPIRAHSPVLLPLRPELLPGYSGHFVFATFLPRTRCCALLDPPGESKRRMKDQRQRITCKDCGGSGICDHQRRRTACRDCRGSSFCEHQRRRAECRKCEGSSICVHRRRRSECNPCQRGDTAPAAWPGEAQEMDPIVRDVQLGVDLPPILADPCMVL